MVPIKQMWNPFVTMSINSVWFDWYFLKVTFKGGNHIFVKAIKVSDIITSENISN